MAPKGPDKAAAQAMAKKIEDKTFGMKNKNKSKQVQQKIAQMKHASGVDRSETQSASAAKQKAAQQAIDALLFTEAKSKKDIAREALAKAAAAEAKKEKQKEPDKRDIYTDTRDAKKEEDGMEDWDDAKLAEVVNKKAGGQGKRVPTDIICKHFIDAIEKRQYGWFWECPNGGDKCQYRHALPEGYVLKRDKADQPTTVDEGPRLEDEIEKQRKALTTRTPVTLERLLEWLEKKKAAAAAAEEEEMEALRAKYAKTGKASGVTGKQLFSIDASLFVDDAAANDVSHDAMAEPDEGEDEGEEDGEGEDGGKVTAASKAQVIVPLAMGDIRPPTPPPQDPDPEPEPDLPPPPPPAPPTDGAQEGADGSATAGGPSSSEPDYGDNYEATPDPAGGSSGGAAAAAAVADLDGVDESLFLDEDLPDDDELE